MYNYKIEHNFKPLQYFIKQNTFDILKTKFFILSNLLSNLIDNYQNIIFISINLNLFLISLNLLNEYNLLIFNNYLNFNDIIKINNYNKEIKHKIINIKSISKTTKKGRIKKIKIIVIIGNETGWFGIGISKAVTFNDALDKAFKSCFNNIYIIKKIYLNGIYKYKKTKLFIKPNKLGFGIKSSFILKWILDLAGYKNFTIKLIGSKNNLNSIYAFLKLCSKLNTKTSSLTSVKNLLNIKYTDIILLYLIKNLTF